MIKMLLLGLLGLILLMFAGLDWIILFVTKWLFDTRIISWIFSCFPNFISNVAFAAVQANLLCWSLTRLFSSLIHVKVQNMTLAYITETYTSKLVLTFDSIKYSNQNISIDISSPELTFHIDSDPSWVLISISKLAVSKRITNGTDNPWENGSPTNDPPTTEPTYLERFLNYQKSGLLPLLLRHLELFVRTGTVQVFDKSRQYDLTVNLNFHEFHFGKHYAGVRRFDYAHLSISDLWAEIDLVQGRQKANVLCKSCYVNFFNFSHRDQPYSSKLLNVLLGRQHMNMAVTFIGTSFHLGHNREKTFDYKRGDLFYIKEIEVELANQLSETREKVMLNIETKNHIHLMYTPYVPQFVFLLYQYLAQYGSPDENNRTNSVPSSTSEQSFPAALDMAVKVTLCRVSCLLWNEHDSCLWVYCKQLTMNQSNSERTILINSVGLQMGDHNKAENFTKMLGEFFISYPEEDNDKLAVEEIAFKHAYSHEEFQQLFINLKNLTITWNEAVQKHIMQMFEEISQFRAELNKLLPPSPAGKTLSMSVTLFGSVRCFIPLTAMGPTIKMVTPIIKATDDGKWIINIYELNISVTTITIFAMHKFICVESDDTSNWKLSTENRAPVELNIATLCEVVFAGLVPIHEQIRLLALQLSH